MTDIVTSWLPTQEEYRNEEWFEEDRRIALGHLTLIEALLDVVQPMTTAQSSDCSQPWAWRFLSRSP